MAADSCCSCNAFGFRIFCHLPTFKAGASDTQSGVQAGQYQDAGISSSHVFYKKKKRERWARNLLTVLYCIGGFGGLALLVTVLAAWKFRGPIHSCQEHYIGSKKTFCDLNLVPDKDVLTTTDIALLVESCITVALAAIGINAAWKGKQRCLTLVSVGFGLAFVMQVAIGGVIGAREFGMNYQYPYVPNQVQLDVKATLNTNMRAYNSSKSAQEKWNRLQIEYCCCGIVGYKDWDAQVPSSCSCRCTNRDGRARLCNYWQCQSVNGEWQPYIGSCDSRPGTNATVYPDKGCLGIILSSIGSHRNEIMTVVCIVAFGLTSLQILAALGPLFASCCRCCCIPTAQATTTREEFHVPERTNDGDDEPLLTDHDMDAAPTADVLTVQA